MRTLRELSDAEVMEQAQACRDYLRKPKNLGASFWATSKGFAPADRAAVLMALGDMDDDDVTGMASSNPGESA